ncbi:MAG: ribosome biogenesis GTP-binding protein YihA/YsxC [Firmicutes bacterium]|nr:ribosome biogenesis GTP-binding protein YihA/YsxC [Bacillota bacterium]
MDAQFYKSFTKIEQMEEVGDLPQVAFVGRSNAGKSSLLNMLTNRKGLAVTSQKPGRTRLINFFNINNKIYFVDLPGYGYSVANKSTTDGWGNTITEYLLKSQQLKLVFVLMDIRHEPSPLDVTMLHFLQAHSLPFKIIATKADKLSKSQQQNHRQKLAAALGVGTSNIIVTSASAKLGREEVMGLVSGVQS